MVNLISDRDVIKIFIKEDKKLKKVFLETKKLYKLTTEEIIDILVDLGFPNNYEKKDNNAYDLLSKTSAKKHGKLGSILYE